MTAAHRYLENRAEAAEWMLARQKQVLWWRWTVLSAGNSDPAGLKFDDVLAQHIFADLSTQQLLLPVSVEGGLAFVLNLGSPAWASVRFPQIGPRRVMAYIHNLLQNWVPLMISLVALVFSFWQFQVQNQRERLYSMLDVVADIARKGLEKRDYGPEYQRIYALALLPAEKDILLAAGRVFACGELSSEMSVKDLPRAVATVAETIGDHDAEEIRGSIGEYLGLTDSIKRKSWHFIKVRELADLIRKRLL